MTPAEDRPAVRAQQGASLAAGPERCLGSQIGVSMPAKYWRLLAVACSFVSMVLGAGVAYLSWPVQLLFVAAIITWLLNRGSGPGNMSGADVRRSSGGNRP